MTREKVYKLNNELSRRAQGFLPSTYRTRDTDKRARQFKDEIEFADYRAKGTLALGFSIAKTAIEVKRGIQSLVEDEAEAQIADRVFTAALLKAIHIQNSVGSGWD